MSSAGIAGIRSNVIVGFPGETEDDVQVLTDFLAAAALDVVGVFGYSDEDDTEALDLPGHLSDSEIDRRRQHVDQLVESLTSQRAADRVGERVDVLVEERAEPEHSDLSSSEPRHRGGAVGRAAHQGPEVDGVVRVEGVDAPVGSWVTATVTASDGVDLIARRQQGSL